jgi:aminopeptidase
VEDERILSEAELERYADALVKASLGVKRGDTLAVYGHPSHREYLLAIVASGYRAGCALVDLVYSDPLATRARLEHGSDAALGVVPPWSLRLYRELTKPTSARAVTVGSADPNYLDGVPPKRIVRDQSRVAEKIAFFRRANLDMRARWSGAPWPTDYWAGQVYPKLSPLEGKRQLAQDFLGFCRLTDADGKGSSGWLEHVRALAKRSAKLSRLNLRTVELRGPGTELELRLTPGTVWLGGQEETPYGVKIAPNMPTEETFTSPHANGANGTFACTFPLSFQGRLTHGLRGEFRNGRLVRLDADDDESRDYIAAHLDSDRSGNGRRLGEVALVDTTSRIGQSGRTYFNTLLDENAAAHIAFGSGFGATRNGRPTGVNRSTVHLDVMIGGPDFEVTGITEQGKRLPVIADGLWQI